MNQILINDGFMRIAKGYSFEEISMEMCITWVLLLFYYFLKVSVNLAGVTSMDSVILQVTLVPIGQQLWQNVEWKTQFLLMLAVMRRTFTYSTATMGKNLGWGSTTSPQREILLGLMLDLWIGLLGRRNNQLVLVTKTALIHLVSNTTINGMMPSAVIVILTLARKVTLVLCGRLLFCKGDKCFYRSGLNTSWLSWNLVFYPVWYLRVTSAMFLESFKA